MSTCLWYHRRGIEFKDGMHCDTSYTRERDGRSIKYIKLLGEKTVMKHFRKELWFEVSTRRALINITPQVEEYLLESGILMGSYYVTVCKCI